MNLRRHVPVGVLVAAAVAYAFTPAQRVMPLRAPLAELPRELVGYRGSDDTVATAELAVLQNPEYLMRTYQQGQQVGLTAFVGYYATQENRDGFHSPQACLPGAGWEPLESSRVRVAAAGGSYEVNRYLVGRGAQRALVVYWFQGRGRVTADEFATKFDLLLDAVRRQRTDQAFVRLVVPMPDVGQGVSNDALVPNATAADAVAREAVAELVPALERILPAGDA